MGLFDKKEEIEKKAQELILEQFKKKYDEYTFGPHPAPASLVARKVLKEAIETKEIQDKIDKYLCTETMEALVKKHINEKLEEIIKEEFIASVVKRINEFQLSEK